MRTLTLFIILIISFNLWAYDFSTVEKIGFNETSNTNSLLIYKNNKRVFEKYANGYDENKKHITWSVSKSISSAIIGAIVYKNKLNIQTSICDYVKIAEKYNHCDLTPNDFLSWSSGLDWKEQYENQAGDPTKSSVAQMLYGDGLIDSTEFVLSHTSVLEGRKRWNYSTGDSHFLMSLASAVVDEKKINTFPWDYLFNPLGLTDVTFLRDVSGNFYGGSGIFIKPRDLAKIGELYLNRGVINGQRLFSEEWYKYTLSEPETFGSNLNNKTRAFTSARSWWKLNSELQKKYKIPDAIYANGHWGQFLVVIPSMNVVIVRMGNNQTNGFPIVQMVSEIVKALENKNLTENAVSVDLNVTQILYQTPIALLGLNYRAQHTCQCLFVMNQAEDYCKNLSLVQPAIFSVGINYEDKSVTSTIDVAPGPKAVYKFKDDKMGCVLVPSN